MGLKLKDVDPMQQKIHGKIQKPLYNRSMPVPSKIQDIEKLRACYIDQQMSTTEITKQSERIFGFKVSLSSVYNSLVKAGVRLRSKAESVSAARCSLDISQSFLTEEILENIDGFLLGDGNIDRNRGGKIEYGGSRFKIGTSEQEWAKFSLAKFALYHPSEPKFIPPYERNPNGQWYAQTLTHPDIVAQAKRWYPDGKKHVPFDVRLTPTSLMLWYLGDGSFCDHGKSNGSSLRFATCNFLPEENETILMPKLEALGLACHLCPHKNDIIIRSPCTGRFFDLIGHQSPISCYQHKFNIPPWLNLKRLRDVTRNKQEAWRASKWLKAGEIPCSRSPGGRLFLFTEEQAVALRARLDV